MEQICVVYEEFKVLGKELVDKVGQLIHAGNVRRIIVKDDKGNTFMEVPLTLATVGTIAAPVLAGLGAIAALIANFTLGVERVKEDTTEAGPEDARRHQPLGAVAKVGRFAMIVDGNRGPAYAPGKVMA